MVKNIVFAIPPMSLVTIQLLNSKKLIQSSELEFKMTFQKYCLYINYKKLISGRSFRKQLRLSVAPPKNWNRLNLGSTTILMVSKQPKSHWKGFTKHHTPNWQTFYRHRLKHPNDSNKKIFKQKMDHFREQTHRLQPNNSIRRTDHFHQELHPSHFSDLVKEKFRPTNHFHHPSHHSHPNNLVKGIFRVIDHFQHHCRTLFQIILMIVHIPHRS